MDNTVRVICQNQYSPHMAAVFVGDIFVGSFPRNDYERLQTAFNLPPFPCTETTDG